MIPNFCTIITANYSHYALTLYITLKKHNDRVILHILIADETADFYVINAIKKDFPHIYFYSTKDLCKDGIAKAIYDKYAFEQMDEFRWSMKSVFMKYLIIEQGCEKIVWADCDLGFFGDYQFIFDELDHYSILLTPHWRTSNPSVNTGEFDLLFMGGLYNAGFVAASKKGLEMLDWWAEVCLYKCVRDFSKGMYVDQTYLNLMPIYFDKVKTLKHRGCNISEWNQDECKRIKMSDGQVLINGKWPLIFIHFTKRTISDILNGKDTTLMPFLEEWYNIMQSYKKDFEINIMPEKLPAKKRNLIQRIINRLSQ